MGTSRSKIRALTGLFNARAREAEAEAAKARTELDARRFADVAAQRDRFTDVLHQDREQREVQIFEYRRLLQPPHIDGDIRTERSW